MTGATALGNRVLAQSTIMLTCFSYYNPEAYPNNTCQTNGYWSTPFQQCIGNGNHKSARFSEDMATSISLHTASPEFDVNESFFLRSRNKNFKNKRKKSKNLKSLKI